MKKDWPIGTHVRFDWDGLQARGIVCAYTKYKTALVVLDKDQMGGWKITGYESRKYPELVDYINAFGWYVPYNRLQRCETKLGNRL